MPGKVMDDPDPGLEIVIHIKPWAGDLDLIKAFSSGKRKPRQLFSSIRTGKRILFTVFQRFERGNENTKPHQCHRLDRITSIGREVNYFAGGFIHLFKQFFYVQIVLVQIASGRWESKE